MTRSHILLHCSNERLRAARMEAWKGTWRCPGFVSQSQVGAAVCKVPGAVGSGEGDVMVDGTDEDGARAAKMDEWVVWMRWREQPLGVIGDLLFSLRSFIRGARTPRLAHTAPPGGGGLICLSIPTEG
jgi:hypothetical protein